MVPEPLPFEQDIHELELAIARLEASPDAEGSLESLRRMRREVTALKRVKYGNLTAWETVQVSRHRDRPQFLDYVQMAFDEFVELHGDRAFGDDRAIRAGFARIDGH